MRGRLLILFFFLFANAACTSIPKGKSGVDAVTVRGADKVDSSDTLDKIATAETPKFLGLFRGVVYDYVIFDRFVLQRDLARIERFYQARGYYDAKARAGRVIRKNNNHVRVEIVVEEGPPVLVHDLEVVWPEGNAVPDKVKLQAYLAAKKLVPPNKPFDEDKFKDAEDVVKKAVTDAGYAFAKVSRDAAVNVTEHTATVTYVVAPDLPAKFGKITVKGLDPDGPGPQTPELPEDKIRSTIAIKEGQTYSTAEIESASAALTDLNVFSSVRIVPTLTDPPPADHVVPLVVTLEPTKLRGLRLGGGVEFDQLKVDVHGVIGWEDHNFAGNLRDFQVTFKPGVILYPTRLDNLVPPTRPLLEEKLQVAFKQPSFLEARTEGFIRPELNVYPILVPNYKTTDPIIGYIEPKVSVGLDRLFFRRLFITLSQNEQIEAPFPYIGTLDSRLSTILLSYPELKVVLDLSDSRLHPHKGIYIANTLQVAGNIFGGTASDVKVQPEVRGYIPLGKRLTLAMRGTFGLIFPQNWGDYIRHGLNDFTNGTQNSDSDVRDLEIDLFRGFYGGGATSNRGYPARGIGAYTFVPFFNPGAGQFKNGADCADAVARPPTTPLSPSEQGARNALLNSCRTPVGGMSIWEASAELRILLTGPLSMATFCDAGDVSPAVASIRPDHPHVSCGLGGRYDTPVGPIRVDLGYRIPGLQAPSDDPLEATDAEVGTILGAPIAIAAGIGEAF